MFVAFTARFHRSSQDSNTNTGNSVHKAPTANPSNAKLVPRHQYNSPAPSINGSTNRYHKLHNHTKFGSNKYVFINDSKDKQSKPAVSKLPVQPKNSDIQCTPTKKFTGSRNDVFRFTAVPKPTSTTCTLVMKNSATVQESCKKNQPETAATTATTNIHHKLKCVYTVYTVVNYCIVMFVLYSEKRNGVIIPSRSQLKWTSKDNVTTQPAIVNSKPQTPIVPQASHRSRTKQPPSRSRFTWRRSSLGRPLIPILYYTHTNG